ncbi:MAG: hypothetical protein LUG57_02120 [Oscillospiraceae bacterium]|nr:hypothetical protein [Oscillospiraceae bacterium]
MKQNMDMEQYAQQVRQGKNGPALEKLAASEAGARLAAQVDGERLTQAARQGDTQALANMLKGILSTPEGRSFAAQVEKAVRNGQ